MSLIPIGKAREMRTQLVRPTFRTDFSALLKTSQQMAPPNKAKPNVEQEQVDFGGDEAGGPQAAGQSGQQPAGGTQGQDGMSVQRTTAEEAGKSDQMQPLDPAAQQRAKAQQQQVGQQQAANYIKQVEVGMSKLLNTGGVSADFKENPEQGTVTYNIKVQQYYTDDEGIVYDNLGVAQAIREFAANNKASTIQGPLLPTERQAPKGLFKKLPEWPFVVTFGGSQKEQESEMSSHGVEQPSQHAKPVGRIGPNGQQTGGAAGAPGDFAKAASVGFTLPELISLRKDELVRMLAEILRGAK